MINSPTQGAMERKACKVSHRDHITSEATRRRTKLAHVIRELCFRKYELAGNVIRMAVLRLTIRFTPSVPDDRQRA
ncbi:hypothetical protein Tcan_01943 [Toxocara canis]|uniref:Uncharacterized protein n=1 Tax=Toxocara canis TaxID=6265 RepID=A0A0B2V5S3_TOXCA|nr:hypothetical protein Tcan_01943 [Toxocara canis]